MAKYTDAAGANLTKTEVTALTTQTTPLRVFSGKVYQKFTPRGAAYESGTRLVYGPGSVLSQADFDGLFATATVTSVTPSTGLPAAGGTVVTIVGTSLGGVESVTFGGTAGTALTYVSDTSIKVTTPAKTAGVVAVVVVDDSGSVAAGNVTFV